MQRGRAQKSLKTKSGVRWQQQHILVPGEVCIRKELWSRQKPEIIELPVKVVPVAVSTSSPCRITQIPLILHLQHAPGVVRFVNLEGQRILLPLTEAFHCHHLVTHTTLVCKLHEKVGKAQARSLACGQHFVWVRALQSGLALVRNIVANPSEHHPQFVQVPVPGLRLHEVPGQIVKGSLRRIGSTDCVAVHCFEGVGAEPQITAAGSES
mmetsp:Transcript_57671/g.95521  ORF Transcript_57671/g.95521 Transcript_57671/m.95521 type:complete len:210 (-) Transcript_57671:825-1454(-)